MSFRVEELSASERPAAAKESGLHSEFARAGKIDFKINENDVSLNKLTLVDVADQKAEPEKIAKLEKAEKPPDQDILKYLISLKPDQIGPGLGQARDAARQLEAQPDIKAAAAGFEPKFAGAVKKSDEDYADAVASHWGDLSLARRDASMKASVFMTNVQAVNENMKAVPAEKRDEIAAMVNLMQKDDLSEGLRGELRKSVGQYPGVLSSFDTARAAQEQAMKAMEAVNKAQEPLLKAAREQVASRYVLAEVLKLSGKSSEAFTLKQEAMEQYNKTSGEIIGQPVQPKPLLRA